jgi:hypothetical protein
MMDWSHCFGPIEWLGEDRQSKTIHPMAGKQKTERKVKTRDPQFHLRINPNLLKFIVLSNSTKLKGHLRSIVPGLRNLLDSYCYKNMKPEFQLRRPDSDILSHCTVPPLMKINGKII